MHRKHGRTLWTWTSCCYSARWMMVLLMVLCTELSSFAFIVPTSQRRTTISKGSASCRSSLAIRKKTRVHASQQQQPKSATRAAKSFKKKGKRNRGSNGYYNRRTTDRGLAKAKALNKAVVSGQNSLDVLAVLASTGKALTGLAGGGSMNSVNFSTALHRIARHAAYSKEDRARTLSDARFALLVAAVGEALSGMDYTQSLASLQQQQTYNDKKGKTLSFGPREYSNIAWAIAKLRIAPPSNVLPVDTSAKAVEDLLESCLELRNEVISVAKERKQHSGANDATVRTRWVPILSKLSGRLMDAISYNLLTTTRTFNSQEWANLLWALATAGRGDSEVFDHIAERLVEVIIQKVTLDNEMPKPQELSNSVWAYATSGFYGPVEEEMIMYLADLMDSSPEFVASFKPQELSNTVWGIATILSNKRDKEKNTAEHESEDLVVARICRHAAKAITERVEDYKSQEISNTLWAFATLGFGYDESGVRGGSLSDYLLLSTDDQEGDMELVAGAFNAVAQRALTRLNTFRPQELNNLAWSCSRLCEQADTAREILVGVGDEFRQPHRRFTSQDIGTTLWSFASKEYFDEDVYKVICSHLTFERAPHFKPQEVSNTLWALATASLVPKYPDAFDTSLFPKQHRPSLAEMSDDPVTMCFAAGAEEAMRRPDEFIEQELKDVLWSFSRIGLRHPKLFKSVAEHLVGTQDDSGAFSKGRGLDKFTPQGIGNLCWSVAKQAKLTEGASERVEGGSGSTGRLAIYSTSCIDLGEFLVRKLFNAIADAAVNNHDRLARFKPQDISNTVWSMALLGLWHREFFEVAAEQVIERTTRLVQRQGDKTVGGDWMDRFKGQEIANIVWAFATLNQPMHDVIDAISHYIIHICSNGRGGDYDAGSIARQFKRQELANTVWSCAVAGRYPIELLHLLYIGLIGSGSETDPAWLRQIYGDGGLQRQAMSSLLYAQMVMDVEMPDNDVTLPENFPDGWYSDAKTVSSDDTETPSLMDVNSSKMQKAVSAALDRIGFQHVEEHFIGMQELVENHGIKLSTKKMDILSMDIANLEEKIGIEVDGPAHFFHVLDDADDEVDQAKADGRGFAKVINGRLQWQFLDTRQYMNGPTSLKERLLTNLGWRLLHIPYWEWARVEGDEDKENDYLKNLLEPTD